MEEPTNFSLSLAELEDCDWGKPKPRSTFMVRRIYALREKPLDSFTADEIRLAVGQGVGFPYILDLAFKRLEVDPLLEGDCYPGDILSNLILADPTVWEQRPALRSKLSTLYARALSGPAEELQFFRESLGLPEDGSGPN